MNAAVTSTEPCGTMQDTLEVLEDARGGLLLRPQAR
jgi:hypothetical protein